MAVRTWNSKQSSTVSLVARQLLAVPVGDRIPTVARLASEAGVGSGTVQATLSALRECGAVKLVTHGHQGTRLIARNLAELWALTGASSLSGVLPLPASLEFSGLATALVETFAASAIPLQLSFRQGAVSRLAFVESRRVDFAVCSAAAATALLADDSLDVAMLRPHTFYASASVVVITRAGEPRRERGVVPIDRDSHDHRVLTEAEFPDAKWRDAPYGQIPELVVRGDVDAAVWHRTSSSPLLTATGLDLHPLRHRSPADRDDFSRAALVSRVDDPARKTLLSLLLDPEELVLRQRQIIDRVKVPAF